MQKKETSSSVAVEKSSQHNSKIKKVKKRDGRIVDFDGSKIERAVLAALNSVEEEDAEEASVDVAKSVIKELEESYSDSVPSIEDIQDVVEKGISEAGYFDASRAYILYREKQKRLREETVSEHEEIGITVVKRDGTRVPYDFNQIENQIREFFDDVDDKTVMYDVLDELKLSVFDGMTTQQISQSMCLAVVARIEKGVKFSRIAARIFANDLYKQVFGEDEFSSSFEETYRSNFETIIERGVENNRLEKEMLDFDFDVLSSALVLERDKLFRYRGIQMLAAKYVLKDEEQNILEVPQYFWMRVAMGLALNEEEKEEKALKFYSVMSQLLYIPSSPTLYHSGLVHSQMSSCFLMTVEDDLHHIFKSYSDQAQLAKYAGGIGLDWTNIRATGAMIKSTNVPSQGVVPFLKICDSTNASINRSGRKRGAAVVYLEPWHFDIESFLELRRNVGDERRRTHNINTALWIPDLFMQRVIDDGDWTLFSPDETPELHALYGKAFNDKYVEYEREAAAGNMTLVKKMKAKDLWKKMITMLFETGHPWLNWKDACNIRSPQDHAGVVHSSNLCTEITLNTSADEIAVCNLGSVNLSMHTTDSGELNRVILEDTIKTAMRILDNVIDLNFYPVVETKNSNMKHRPVGLGIMGFQDVLSKNSISFDSEVAVKYSDEIQEFVAYHAILGSSELAKERGKYKSYAGSKWDRGILPLDTLDMMEEERDLPTNINKDERLDWQKVRKHIEEHGMRNSNCMAIAPTASISNLAGCYPSIEPPYSNLYVKSNMFGEFTVSNEYLVKDLTELGLWNDAMLEEIKANDGNIQDISEIPVHIRSKYKGAFSIDPHWIVRHAAHRGKWIDQSQSINIFTNSTRGKVLSDIYMDAWVSGLKTTYYLRSLGASSIEKSTVSLDKQSASVGMEDIQESSPAPAVVEVAVPSPSVMPLKSSVVLDEPKIAASVASVGVKESSKQISLPTVNIPATGVDGQTVSACRLDDPTCESCQ